MSESGMRHKRGQLRYNADLVRRGAAPGETAPPASESPAKTDPDALSEEQLDRLTAPPPPADPPPPPPPASSPPASPPGKPDPTKRK